MKTKNQLTNLINYLLPWRQTMTTTTQASVRVPNYTDDQVAMMIADYEENPTLDTVALLATSLNKNKRSIIAKLVREGVYKAQARATKSGAPVIRKAELVSQIQDQLGITLPSLEKASKQDLEVLVDAIRSEMER